VKPVIPLLVLLVSFLTSCANQGGQSSEPSTYTISGSVANLAAGSNGLMLQNNGGDNLSVTANGNFRFANAVQKGGAYSVTVLTQPSSPVQQCTVANGVGTATNNVSNILVECGHNEWAWMAGSQTINQVGTYGTLGMPDPANTPAGRQSPATWTDANGALWLFGGYGYDSNGNLLPMNDLWKFSAGEWTWMDGPTLAGQSGNYGTLGVATPYGIPGARFQAISWTDASGNFWLFGGNGFDSVGNESPMNDLWKYSALPQVTEVSINRIGHTTPMAVLTAGFGNDLWKYSNGQWTWISGANVGGQSPTFGTEGMLDPGNTPGGRFMLNRWIDSDGNLWLFGGYGQIPGSTGNMNDLWMYMP